MELQKKTLFFLRTVGLVQVVEMLGKKANGIFANLEIEDIPSGTQYRIEEHDGSEWIEYNTPDYWEIA